MRKNKVFKKLAPTTIVVDGVPTPVKPIKVREKYINQFTVKSGPLKGKTITMTELVAA
jgi:hypothetical protein